MADPVRVSVQVRGQVQGVGLRPWVLRSARALGLAGTVRNVRTGVEIELEGAADSVGRWLDALRDAPPPGARIESLAVRPGMPEGLHGFEIAASESGERSRTAPAPMRIPRDIGLCAPCRHEVLDPASRRYRHAFAHCATCGPRASVIAALPYDRARTSLAAFPLCAACAREYADPDDRRFHAQTICCHDCGPRLRVLSDGPDATSQDADPMETAAAVLAGGGVVALQGFGGFHLLVDATSGRAVAQLRKRKARPTRPLGILVPDLERARRLVALGPDDEALLDGPTRALVVAPRRESGCLDIGLAAGIAPGTSDLGLLLPQAPAHLMLFHPPARPHSATAPGPEDGLRFEALVMTSANQSGDPTIHEPEVAVRALCGIADLIVGHDREIRRPSDDSVFRSAASGPIPIRLSRSTAPLSMSLPAEIEARVPILALGNDLKCAPAIALGRELVLAEHVGDLGSPASADALLDRIEGLCRLLGVVPQALAVDAHPDALGASIAASSTPAGTPRIAVQHHHAHALSCLADHGSIGPALAITLDGTGFGSDGRPWGGELLHVDAETCERLAHLETVPLPGGDRAAREPWRMAAMWLSRAFPGRALAEAAPDLDWHRRRDRERLRAVEQIASQGVGSPETSSCGRLFDAVASLLGLCDVANHEAEAGAALEALAREAARGPGSQAAALARADDPARPAHSDAPGLPRVIRMGDVIRWLVDERRAGRASPQLALAFHLGLADRLVDAASIEAGRLGVREVALSGGCFQNRILLDAVRSRLESAGLVPLLHVRVPPNDAGLAIGQLVAAAQELSRLG